MYVCVCAVCVCVCVCIMCHVKCDVRVSEPEKQR